MLKPYSPTGEELIFYNYKEPLKPVANGYGYMGVILSNKDGTAIQCHICGGMYGEVSMHSRQMHNITTREYKEKFELAKSTALVSESIRVQRKLQLVNYLKNLSPEQMQARRANANKGAKAYWKNLDGGRRTHPGIALETKNKRGTCPDQLLHKIKLAAESLGHSPSKVEFIDYCGTQKFLHIIYKTFGSWDRAKEMAGYKVLDKGSTKGKKKPRYSPEELIEYLQIFFQENQKAPTETDCRRGLIPDSSIYRRVFGSLPRARAVAGINDEVGRWAKNDLK